MARYTKTVTIDVPGRDFGKIFELTEMHPAAAFEWVGRAFFAVGNAGMQVPLNALENAKNSDDPLAVFYALAAFAGQALLGCTWTEAQALTEQAWRQIKIKDSPDAPARPIDFAGDDLEEVWTIIQLKRELLDMHLGVSVAAEFSKFIGSLADQRKTAMALAEKRAAAEA